MDSRQLRYFIAIYEHRTLSGAADNVRIATSALSYHLTNLEQRLGTALFDRKPRGLAPTAAGDRLYRHAQSILSAIDAAERDITAGRQEVTGRVAIGLGQTAIKAIGLPLLRAVARDYPRLHLVVSESLSGGNMSNLVNGEIALAFIYNPPVVAGVRITPAVEEPLVCLGKPSIIGASSKPLRFKDVLKLPLISLRQGISARGILHDRELLKQLEGHARIELNSATFIADALLAGLGCAIINPLFLKAQIKAGLLHARPIVEPRLYRTLSLCELEARTPSFSVEATRRLLLDLVQDAITTKIWSGRWLL